MKIDDLMFQHQQRVRQEAIDRGEEPPEELFLSFSRLQDLIQGDGELSSAEVAELEHLLEQIGVEHGPDANEGQPIARDALEQELINAAQVFLARHRLAGIEQSTPEESLRQYAPGPPTPEKEEGATLPLHHELLAEQLPDEGE